MKKILAVCLACVLLITYVLPASAEEDGPQIESPAAILMEASTGTVLYEKGADDKRSPASVTKIMTVLLVFEALESGKLKLDDEVVTSAHAKSMGGSQVFLEEGEKQTVQTMLKCIIISSGNDAAVAMAEKIGGTEEEFVKKMNRKAKELGMNHTNFVDCCGLTESPDHYTTARDIALMSRELITKFPQVFDYSTIWMENITHNTAKGSSEFGLTNTNKLLRSYDGCVGLKTGSTSLAKYCVSEVAKRNGITLISVVMTAPDYKVRFKDAAAMLNLGFGACNLYVDENKDSLPKVPVKGAIQDKASVSYEGDFRYLDTKGEALDNVQKKINLKKSTDAPVKKGSKAGTADYYLNGKKIGSVNLFFSEKVEKAGYMDYVKKVFKTFF